MKIFKAEQIRKADQYTIENEPIKSIDLMERAALQLRIWIENNYSITIPVRIFVGPGNNGGDGWALARLLSKVGFSDLQLFLLDISNKISPDSEINRQRLKDYQKIGVITIRSESDFPELKSSDLIIDGLFGSGLSRELSGLAAKLVEHLNKSEKFQVIAIDIPSGLFAEPVDGNKIGPAIKADHTLSFQFPKLSFFFSEFTEFVGNWHVLPIGLHTDFINKEPTSFHYIVEEDIREYIKPRNKFSHKGTYGHALIIAGSYGMMGAAVLSTRAAVSSGTGLVTAHIPRLGYEILQIAVPEALASIDESDLIYTGGPDFIKYSAVAVGPGLNQKSNTRKAIEELFETCNKSLVIDADALNIIAQNQKLLELIPENTIITPHPGEFDRLTKKHQSHYSRLQSQINFSIKHKLIVVLKGAHTSIALPDGSVYFNSTGNPGMATGGSGDILTGMLVALLAQGYEPEIASKIGVFLHGRAGDYAAEKFGQHGLSASSIIEFIGPAFKKLEKND